MILLPIAGDLDLNAVELQMRVYNVTSLPSLVINEEIVLEGFHTIEEIKSLAKFPSEDPNPVLRISKDCKIIYANDEPFEIGGCKVVKQSADDRACVIGAGVTLFEAIRAQEQLAKEGILVSVIDLYCIKPLDLETIRSVIHASGKRLVTVEDHYCAFISIMRQGLDLRQHGSLFRLHSRLIIRVLN